MTTEGSAVHDKARAAYDAVQASSGAIPGTALTDASVAPVKLTAGALAADEVSTHDDASALVLLTAPTGVGLAFVCTVLCTETIAATTTDPTFSAGDGTTVDDFVATTEYAAAGTAGNRFTFGGQLAAGESLTITNTDGTGGAEAGAFNHTVVAHRI
jgi:hypothetical protein